MNKFDNFHKAMLIATCALFIGFVLKLLYRSNDVLVLSIISQVCFLFAFIIQVTALLFMKKQNKNSSDVVNPRDKIFRGLSIAFSLILLVVVIILLVQAFL